MDLSIIIPSFNTKNLLDRCLSSIVRSLKNSSLSYEIIVVDNASGDGSRELLEKKYTRIIKIFNTTNLGYGRSNNMAIKIAKGKYILLLNSDIQVLDEAISKLYEFTRHREKVFAGGKLLNEDKSDQTSCGPMFTLPVVFVMLFLKGDSLGITRASPDKLKQIDWVSGACLMGSAYAFRDIGMFDENIFMYMDEIDFLYRAKQKSYTTFFVPDARFVHTGAASSSSRRTPVVNIYRGLIYFYKKHRSIMELYTLKFMLKLKSYLAIFIGKATRDNRLVEIYEETLGMV